MPRVRKGHLAIWMFAPPGPETLSIDPSAHYCAKGCHSDRASMSRIVKTREPRQYLLAAALLSAHSYHTPVHGHAPRQTESLVVH